MTNQPKINISSFKLDMPKDGLVSLLPVIKCFDVYVYGELEIEPFEKFSFEFSSAYWYTKYMLTQNAKVPIDEDNIILFETENINPIWLNLTDGLTFRIQCFDGNMSTLEKFGLNEELEKLMKNEKIELKPEGNKL
jgi:hypothetical protein